MDMGVMVMEVGVREIYCRGAYILMMVRWRWMWATCLNYLRYHHHNYPHNRSTTTTTTSTVTTPLPTPVNPIIIVHNLTPLQVSACVGGGKGDCDGGDGT